MDQHTRNKKNHQAPKNQGSRGDGDSKRRGGERSELTIRVEDPAPRQQIKHTDDDRTMTQQMTAHSHKSIDRAQRPDPEGRQKTTRRRFSAKDKQRILEEADLCVEHGQIGALLRREGIYSSQLAQWRRQRKEQGTVGLAEKKRGPAPTRDPLRLENARLVRENTRLYRKLEESKLIIDIQKKTSILLGLTLSDVSEHEKIVFGDE